MSEQSYASVPPQNLDAEESVLGSMLLSPRAVDAVAEVLRSADFYRASHGRIFDTALALNMRNEPVDAITLSDELEKLGLLEEIGGRVRINELAALVPASSNAAHYARIVREMSIARSLVRAGQEMARLGFEREGRDGPGMLDAAETIVYDLTQDRTESRFVSLADTVGPAFQKVTDAYERGEEITGVPSGLRPLDEVTSGFQPGNLVVLAARPSMGKSGLALGILANIAIRLNAPVALFTLEMSQSEVTQRLMSQEGLVESNLLRNGKLNAEQWRRLTGVSDRLVKAPLYIDDAGLITMTEIRSKARRLKMQKPDLQLVCIDYLQLMTSGVSQENRNQEISAISRSLKVLAGELGVPVLALSQLSRGVETRHDKRPVLSDLRDSGAIEQDADVVIFIYRDEYYNPEDTDQVGIAELNIAKHRNGPTNTVKVAFMKRFARFGELAPTGMGGSPP
ncbi:MAG: replicative DNA helicase [Myxococcales bacterium]